MNDIIRVKAYTALMDWWVEDTQFHSSIDQMQKHVVVKTIKVLGEPMLHYLFHRVDVFVNEYDTTKGLDHVDTFGQPIHHLMIAISAITKRHPRIPRSAKGKVLRVAEHYLTWGKEMGYHSTY